MIGLEIPKSFRNECECCQGSGGHQVCTPLERRCELCDGTGYVMNELGRDLMKMLAHHLPGPEAWSAVTAQLGAQLAPPD